MSDHTICTFAGATMAKIDPNHSLQADVPDGPRPELKRYALRKVMKFFTKEWWFGDAPDADLVFERYRAYISSVRDRLPVQLVDLYENHTLHDAEVKRIAMSAVGGTVEMDLLGWDIELQNQVRYCLRFSGVSAFEQMLPEAEYVEQELGDLGYWECEYLGHEVEMRMLFATEATFTVRFSGFAFSASAVRA